MIKTIKVEKYLFFALYIYKICYFDYRIIYVCRKKKRNVREDVLLRITTTKITSRKE